MLYRVGAFLYDLYKRVALPPKSDVYSNIEALMNHFKLVYEGILPPPGEVYGYTEAANGELGFYVVSDGGPAPYRWHVRAPSLMTSRTATGTCAGAPDVMWMQHHNGIFRSTDAGDTWTEITRNEGLPKGVIGNIGLAVSPASSPGSSQEISVSCGEAETA